MADRRHWIGRCLELAGRAIIIGYVAAVVWRILCGCTAADFTVAEPLILDPDAITEADLSDTRIDDDTSHPAPDGSDAATWDTATDTTPAGDTGTAADTHASPPDTTAADTHPISETATAPDTAPTDTAAADTGKVACANLSPAACAAYTCDEPMDCPGVGRCCLVPDGGGSTCACSSASMDSWIVLCRTESDCGGFGHCTPWDAWTGHGRCL